VKQTFTISSGKNDNTTSKVLSIKAGEQHFGFSITNADAKELYELSWYTGVNISATVLDEIYQQQPLLGQTFFRILIGYDYPQNIITPQLLFQQHASKQQLYTMHGVSIADTIQDENIAGWQLQNSYAVPAELTNWMNKRFAHALTFHSHTIGVKNIEATDFEGSMAIDFRTEDFSIIVSKANKLLLAQTYGYSTPADVIYILLNICTQFSFSPQNIRVTIAGLIDKQSALYRELYMYFIQLRFREAEWTPMVVGEVSYPSHFFTSLNDLARCV
jgi:Protein of unknown function (DUF3822)